MESAVQKEVILNIPSRFQYNPELENEIFEERILKYHVGDREFLYDMNQMSHLHIFADMMARQMMNVFRSN